MREAHTQILTPLINSQENPRIYFSREQKLFIEASDWEAKFYQIQSKYLLLLNELHNPQVCHSLMACTGN